MIARQSVSRAAPRPILGLLLAALFVWSYAPAYANPAAPERELTVSVALEAAERTTPERASDWLGGWVRALRSPSAAGTLSVRHSELLEAPDPGSEVQGSAGLDWLAARRAPGPGHAAVLARISRAPSGYSVDVRASGGGDLEFVLLAERPEQVAEALRAAAERVRRDLLGDSGTRPGPLLAQLDEPPPGLPPTAGEEPEPTLDPGEEPPETAPVLPTGPRPTVVGVRVDGERRIEADAILAVVSTRRGEPLDPEVVADDIGRIYELGFFRDVQVLATDAPGGTIVTYTVEENPIIRRVSISGNENLDGDDIKEKMTLSVGSAIDYPLLIENQERIQALYQTKGYYQAEVIYEIEALDEGIVAVNFDVEEGRKLRLREIRFNGNESIGASELLNGLETKPWRWYSLVSQFWDHSGLYAEPIFMGDLDTISRKYGDQGFIRAHIGQPDVEVNERGIIVNVDIIEGPQFSVGRIDVLGDDAMDRERLLASVQLEPGEIFSRGELSDDVERLKGYYENLGFFEAAVSPRTQVNSRELLIDVTFEVEKGGLFFVDNVDISGNTRTRDRVIRREMNLGEGELYSLGAMRRSQRRIRRLGFFEEVEIGAQGLNQAGRVGLEIDVVERPTGSFSFGAGVGSTDGFVVTGSLRQDNLGGRGRAAHASADIGSRNSRLFVSYIEPYVMGTVATFNATVSNLEREFLDFDEDIRGLNLSLDYPLDESDTRIGGGYGFSSRGVSSFELFRAASMLQREDFGGDTTTSQLSLSLRRDTRDDIRFPNRGLLSGISLDYAGVGGLNEFVRLEARSSHWLPIRWLPFEATFMVNGRVGWALPFNDIGDFDLPSCGGDPLDPNSCAAFAARSPDFAGLAQIDDDLDLPLTERYFLGGLGSFQLRGYKQRAVGPRRAVLTSHRNFSNPADRAFSSFGVNRETGECTLQDGCNRLTDTDDDDFVDLDETDVIGGNKMLLLNLELQFPLSEELGLKGLVFTDMGNAYAENEGFDLSNLRFGAGGGVQWFSPFGPITIILGIPLNKLEDEDASVFEFSMGGQTF